MPTEAFSSACGHNKAQILLQQLNLKEQQKFILPTLMIGNAVYVSGSHYKGIKGLPLLHQHIHNCWVVGGVIVIIVVMVIKFFLVVSLVKCSGPFIWNRP